MNSKIHSKFLMTFGLAIVALLFQNFDFGRIASTTLEPIDQDARVLHAKELLGKHYRGSLAQKAEAISDLQVTIYNDIHKNLPKKYRAQALTLTMTLIAEAQANDLDPVFVMAVIKTESSFNPKARGSHGEIGLMQLKPDTAQWIAEKEDLFWQGPKTLENPVENVRIGITYLALLREQSSGFANKYLSAYNLGLAKVRRMYKASKTPKEYSVRVMKNYKDIYKRMIASRTEVIAQN